jgi:hypothetical protein
MFTSPITASQESSSGPPDVPGKPSRVLACLLCQQRKVKCDRKLPCGNCIKSRVRCVPAIQVPRKRKRRFPERELLDRLRNYEDLLRENSIEFEPLHSSTAVIKKSPKEEGDLSFSNEQSKAVVTDHPSPETVDLDRTFETKYVSCE